jgi:iron complex outermembrane recepter protein
MKRFGMIAPLSALVFTLGTMANPKGFCADAATETSTLDEIVVTASKRAEKLQDVAGSVSALSGDLMEQRHAEGLLDYAQYLPGLDISSNGSPGYGGVTLRGIAPLGITTSVAAYVDEVPMGSSSGWTVGQTEFLDVLPYDLDRIEVLRGPQGTLYGASTLGGLVKYVLKAPNLQDYAAQVGTDLTSVDGGSRAGYSVRGSADIPLIRDQLGLRLSVYDKYIPGFIDNVLTGASNVNHTQQSGGRLALLWRPSDALSVKFNALRMHTADADGAIETYAGGAAVPTSDGTVIANLNSPTGKYKESHAFPARFTKDVTFLSSTIDWNAGPFDVISATGWTRNTVSRSADATPLFGGLLGLFGVPGGLAQTISPIGTDKVTQELRLVSAKGHVLDWLIGGFYTREDSYSNQDILAYDATYAPVPVVSPLISIVGPLTYREYAAFGDLTWHVTDRFDVSGGARYADNRQTMSFDAGGTLLGPPRNVTLVPTTAGVTTWSESARYHLSNDVMLYERVATGYRPGGFNNPLLQGSVPEEFRADTLTNYEAGLKSVFLDHRVLVDLSVFWIDWKNIQISGAYAGSNFPYIGNAGAATSRGLELTTSYSPVANLQLGFNGAYTKAQIDTVPAGVAYSTGYQLPDVPKYSWSLTADYTWNLPQGWIAHAGGGLRWNDREWSSAAEHGPTAIPTIEMPSYTVLNLNASIGRGHLSYRAFVNNATNEHAILGAAFNGVRPASGADVYVMQPRTVGVGVEATF